VFDPFPDHVQLAFEGHAIAGGGSASANEDVLKHRLCGAGAWTDQAIVCGHIAPAKQTLPFFFDDGRDEALDSVAVRFVVRQENQPCTIFARRWKRRRRARPQKGIRHLNEDAGAVAGVFLASARSAVLQIDQDLQRLLDNVVRPPPLDVHNETHATRVVFVGRVVQTLSRRWTVHSQIGHGRHILKGLST
jgi:hypothetical protein